MAIISMLFLFVKQLAFIVARSLKTAQEGVVTDAQSFFRAFPPTLPGDIVPLFRPQGAGDDILTKYNVAHWSG